jgi:hypothetical protein
MSQDETVIKSKLTIDGGQSHAEAMFDEEDAEKAGDVEGASEFATSTATGTSVKVVDTALQLPLPHVPNPGNGSATLPKYLVRCEAVITEGNISTTLEYAVACDDPPRDVVHVASRAVNTRTLEVIPLREEGALEGYVIGLSKRAPLR